MVAPMVFDCKKSMILKHAIEYLGKIPTTIFLTDFPVGVTTSTVSYSTSLSFNQPPTELPSITG